MPEFTGFETRDVTFDYGVPPPKDISDILYTCLLYTSDAADE